MRPGPQNWRSGSRRGFSSDRLYLEPCFGERRNSRSAIPEQSRLPRSFQLGFGLRERFVGHPPQLHQRAINWDLPFGKGKAFGSNMNRAAPDLLVGSLHANALVKLADGRGIRFEAVAARVYGDAASRTLFPGFTADQAPSPAVARPTSGSTLAPIRSPLR